MSHSLLSRLRWAALSLASGAMLLQASTCSTDLAVNMAGLVSSITNELIGGLVDKMFGLQTTTFSF